MSKATFCTAALLSLCASLPRPALAIAPLNLTGGLGGTVRDVVGKPQMGAVVFLYDRRDKLCERVLTNESGLFSFGGLVPEFYTIRVSLSSFLPAVRDHIQVQAGVRRLLEVNLSSLFSSIQLMSPESVPTGLMSEEWKWVLRTSSVNRPVLRVLPGKVPVPVSSRGYLSGVFSDTRAMVKVSAGDTGGSSGAGNEADLGTAFAFATSLYGANQLQFTGNVGYASASGLPSAGFRTTFSRAVGPANPEVSVSVRQLYAPVRASSNAGTVPGIDGTGAPLRTISVSVADKMQISDLVDFEYGFELDSVSYLERLHYFSPYGRLTYQLPKGKIDFTYTSGNARPDLGSGRSEGSSAGTADLERDMAALARIPRLTLADGRSHVQRGEDYEIGISREFGSREIRVSGYRESVKNAALTISSPNSDTFAGDVLPDLFSSGSVFNAGDYHSIGYTTSLTQRIGENFKLTAVYGSVGVLVPESSSVPIQSAGDLRSRIHVARRNAVTTEFAGTTPVTGTRFVASYQWTDYRSATPGHLYSTQPAHQEPGLNIFVRQPLPSFFGWPGHVAATADVRNMLAQGYLPFSLTDGQKLLLMRTPRSLRGGVSFTF